MRASPDNCDFLRHRRETYYVDMLSCIEHRSTPRLLPTDRTKKPWKPVSLISLPPLRNKIWSAYSMPVFFLTDTPRTTRQTIHGQRTRTSARKAIQPIRRIRGTAYYIPQRRFGTPRTATQSDPISTWASPTIQDSLSSLHLPNRLLAPLALLLP